MQPRNRSHESELLVLFNYGVSFLSKKILKIVRRIRCYLLYLRRFTCVPDCLHLGPASDLSDVIAAIF